MKMPYTPGPWKVVGLEPYPNERPSILQLPHVEAKGGGIALVRACANPARAFGDKTLTDLGDTPGCEGWPVGLAIAQANARLIALAPEMAEALMWLVDNMESSIRGLQHTDNERDAIILAEKIREIKRKAGAL